MVRCAVPCNYLIGRETASIRRKVMCQNVTPSDQSEYSALRATIRERGTARICVFVAGVVSWASIAVATFALTSTPMAMLLPLLVLASVFEAVRALHLGVERIGRYLQVFHGDEPNQAWEHVAMAFGRPKGAAAVDALFLVPFFLAALVNLGVTFLVRPTIEEIVFVTTAHLVFAGRLLVTRQAAAKQRAVDLERFGQLKRETEK
jgi:hypothetical protein